MGYDLYPLTCIDNRHKFYAEAIPEKWLVVFTHDHETPLAYVEMGEKGRPVARPVRAISRRNWPVALSRPFTGGGYQSYIVVLPQCG